MITFYKLLGVFVHYGSGIGLSICECYNVVGSRE